MMLRCVYILVYIGLLSCRQQATVEEKAYGNDSLVVKRLEALDEKMPNPQLGDWLYVHEEKGQSFQHYKASKPVRPDPIRRYIYLQPIGQFSAEQLSIVRQTADYLRIFFALEVIVKEPISDEIIPSSARRMFDVDHEQLLTSYIFNEILLPQIPDDAVVVMGITTKDLYPSNKMNFVFGQARLKERVGVSSIFRYTDGPLNSTNYDQCLTRMIKTSSHEIGHMFSCHHCIHAVCVMNGSNSLWESDSRPNRLCSECLMKLHWNLGFDIPHRLKKLHDFFVLHKLSADRDRAARDLELIAE
jgi:archaemetzincin